MDSDGHRAFPSTRLLAAETGLSERAVIDHLALADLLGWLKKASAGFTNKGWRKHRYEPLIPAKVLNEGKHQGAEPRSARAVDNSSEGAERPSKGAEPDDKKVLNNIQSKSTVNSTNNSTADSEDFFLEEEKTKKENKESANKNLVACFAAIGRRRRHPPPDADELAS